MTFHSPQELLGSCCPDSAPSSRSLLGPKGQGEDGLAPSAALSSRDKSPHLPHSRVSEGGSVCRGAAVCCVQLWFVAGPGSEGDIGSAGGGTLLSLCLVTWADSAVARAGGEAGGPVFPR